MSAKYQSRGLPEGVMIKESGMAGSSHEDPRLMAAICFRRHILRAGLNSRAEARTPSIKICQQKYVLQTELRIQWQIPTIGESGFATVSCGW